ncbi:MAG: adenylate/guanylate cyclase domain-containing protein, partial [Nannocystaceae bacterium]
MGDDPVATWLVRHGRSARSTEALWAELCARLRRSGLALLRANVQLRTLHPEVAVLLYLWHASSDAPPVFPANQGVVTDEASLADDGAVRAIALGRTSSSTPEYRQSPLYRSIAHGEVVDLTIDPDGEGGEYPVVPELRAQGGTGYLCLPIRTSGDAVSGLSFLTEKTGGFTDADKRRIFALVPLIELHLERHAQAHILRSLLRTYLGVEPARQVLEGRVRLGDVREVEAAIWFSDLRGYTVMSSALDAGALVAALNDYFAALARPLEARGGELLKFMGDAMLVLFPVGPERDAAATCADALAAAADACAALERLNRRRADAGQPPLGHGIGLHYGRAQYGN